MPGQSKPGVPTDEPQLFHFTNWVTLLHQRIFGYREPTALFGRQQRSVRRALNSIAHNPPRHPPPFSSEISGHLGGKLRKWRLNTLAAQIKSSPGFAPIGLVVAHLEQTPLLSGFASGFFANLPEEPELGLPHTRRFAKELDQLAEALIAWQWPGETYSLDDFKTTLIESPLVLPEFWIDPVNHLDWLTVFQQAATLQDAWKISNLVLFHLKISLLALWDAEYGADAFRAFTPIPLFLNLAPRFRPRPGEEPMTGLQRLNSRKAEVIDGPFSQLIDLIWCLVKYEQHGDWPEEFATVSDMKMDLNNYVGDLVQLRAGKLNLTAKLFYALWPNNLRNRAGELIGPPFPLLAAAHLWDLISPRDRPIVPVDQPYMRAWHRHRHALGASQSKTLPPLIDWPAYLNRGQKILPLAKGAIRGAGR